MSPPPLLIAIDGAAGSGKSTLARGLAFELGLPYVNTGLMYRALTLAALSSGVDGADAEALSGLMRTLRFSLGSGRPAELEIHLGMAGEPSTSSLMSPDLMSREVEAAVSQISSHPAVRALMREAQRRLGEHGAVMEGRDIATVVLPEARVKIYLVADPEVRARRRTAQRAGSGPRELHARDEKDAAVNAFEPAADAVVIDTTDLDVRQTLDAALQLVRDRSSGSAP